MPNPHPNPKNFFPSKGRAALTRLVGVKISADMEDRLKEVAGNNFSSWVREAIAEKLERTPCLPVGSDVDKSVRC